MGKTINKRKLGIFILSVCTAFGVSAQENRDSISMSYDMENIVVSGRRTSEIGATTTILDTFALRSNITYSLAEVLSQNTPIFIKYYGRGTLATASFRGTAPSHTQVLWNGMKINSPMLGMVDFSLIPSYFIDDATVLYGAASVNAAGGGLGGAVVLGTSPSDTKGLGLNYIQGISSYSTYDQFLKATYGTGKLQMTTRVSYVSSKNDFTYTNYDKRPNPDGSYIIDTNKNCNYNDLHIMQEVYYRPNARNRFWGAAWLMDSHRGVPSLTTDYRSENDSRSRQDEIALRAVLGWENTRDKLSMDANIGYIFSDMVYKYEGDNHSGNLRDMVHARSLLYTGYGKYGVTWFPSERLTLAGDVTLYMHWIDTQEKYTQDPNQRSRFETSTKLSAKYKPHRRWGIGAELRQESYGEKIATPVYAGFVDYLLIPAYNVALKASGARNYRHPTLNDLYYQPGGNPDLRPEKSYTYEGGIETRLNRGYTELYAEATVFNSHIKDWILWLPNFKGIWTPINVKKVHSYGVELKGSLGLDLGKEWRLRMDANWAWTRSINHGDPQGEEDESIGKQLVYVPVYSNAVTGQISWKRWSFVYKYNYYSQRFTTTSNEPTRLSKLGSYYMSDISLERSLSFRFAELSLKLCVYNLFNEEYVSVLSRPMPRRNYGFFIGITPNLKRATK